MNETKFAQTGMQKMQINIKTISAPLLSWYFSPASIWSGRKVIIIPEFYRRVETAILQNTPSKMYIIV